MNMSNERSNVSDLALPKYIPKKTRLYSKADEDGFQWWYLEDVLGHRWSFIDHAVSWACANGYEVTYGHPDEYKVKEERTLEDLMIMHNISVVYDILPDTPNSYAYEWIATTHGRHGSPIARGKGGTPLCAVKA